MNTENQIWELRGKMVGMKNITEEKMQKNTKTFEKIIAQIYCGETEFDINSVELTMDFIKYIWKCTLRGFMTLEAFVQEKDLFIAYSGSLKQNTCECKCIPEWLQVQVSEFIEDMNFLVENGVMPEVMPEVMPKAVHTKKEFVDVIMERLHRVKYLSGRVKVVHVLETIKISCDMLEHFEGMERFKEQVVAKIDEFTSSGRLNNDQMYEMKIQRKRIENPIL